MTPRRLLPVSFGLALLLIAPAFAADNVDSTQLTSWGHPDLAGSWSYRTATPLERPAHLGDRPSFTPQEAGDFERAADERFEAFLQSGKVGDYVGDEPWADRGRELTEGQRAALIVDPPGGRLPPRTEAGAQRQAAYLAQLREVPGGPEDRTVKERCLIWPLAPLTSQNYNNNLRIVQTPTHVVLATEMIHHARIVPLVTGVEAPRRATPEPAVRQFLGTSVGRWDGATLVVETAGFRDFRHPLGTSPEMRLVERFTRRPDGSLEYEYTVSDPATFATPWTARQTLRPLDGRIYEYACHEGNHSMELMLRSARTIER